MPTFVFVADIVEENGKTIRENNLALSHEIPIGTIVHVKTEDEDYFGTVVRYTRDCDGTPLYVVEPIARSLYSPIARSLYSKDSLRIADLSPNIEY